MRTISDTVYENITKYDEIYISTIIWYTDVKIFYIHYYTLTQIAWKSEKVKKFSRQTTRIVIETNTIRATDMSNTCLGAEIFNKPKPQLLTVY